MAHKETLARLTSGAGARLFVQIVTAGLSLITMPLFVSHLGEAQYGIWAVCGSLGRYWALFDVGLSTALFRRLCAESGAHRPEELARTAALARKVALMVGGAIVVSGAVVWLVAATRIFPRVGYTLGVIVFICSVQSAMMYRFRTASMFLNASLRYSTSAILELILVLARAGMMAAIVVAGADVTGLAFASAVATAACLVLIHAVCQRTLQILPSKRPVPLSSAATMMRYARTATVVQVGDLLRQHLDPLLIAMILGPTAATQVAIASKLPAYALHFGSSALDVFSALFNRDFAGGNFESLRRSYLLSTKIALAFGVVGSAVIAAFVKSAVVWWMGSLKYAGLYPSILAFTALFAVTMAQMPTVNILFAAARHSICAKISWCEGLVAIALGIIVLQRYGLPAFVLAKAIFGVTIRLGIQPLYACRAIELAPHRYYRTLLRAVLSAAIAAIPAYVLSGAQHSVFLWSRASTAASVSCFSLIFLFCLFNDTEKAALWAAATATGNRLRSKAGLTSSRALEARL